jgi:uncharacterized membrane protein
MRPYVPFGCLSLLFFLGLIILFPVLLANVMLTALGKLGLSPTASLFALLAIFFGSMMNIPVKRIEREEPVEALRFGMFGFERIFPSAVRQRGYTLIAVNVGGCVVPCTIAVFELMRIAGHGPYALLAAVASVGIISYICYRIARPVEGVGIAIPALVPALAAAACGLILLPKLAPLVAFTSGVLGTLIGADLMHLRDIQRINLGMASIGGAGTFDGIVLSGLLATLLA